MVDIPRFPKAAQYFETEGLLGTNALNFSDPHNVIVARTSATVLTLGSTASATLPQHVRCPSQGPWGPRTRAITAPATLTVTPGTVAAGSLVYVYGYVTNAGVFRFAAIVPTGATYVASGTTPCDVFQARVNVGATTQVLLPQILSQGNYLWAWTVDTTGQFNNGGGTVQRLGGDAWVASLHVINATAGAVAVTAAAAGGDTLPFYPTLSVPANSMSVLNLDNPIFVEQGLTLLAASVSSLSVRVNGYRMPVAPTIPPPPGV
jgi:hypothetical protein